MDACDGLKLKVVDRPVCVKFEEGIRKNSDAFVENFGAFLILAMDVNNNEKATNANPKVSCCFSFFYLQSTDVKIIIEARCE